ncbi:tyrosine-type recombinase/integrase [bacterium]|nr:tyrosine-type recombinase/integrase [bacterium]
MAERPSLTVRTIEATPPPASGFLDLPDGDPPGLRLRIYASGRRTWYLRCRVRGGPPAAHRIGSYVARSTGRAGDYSLAEAREQARSMLARARAGLPPREVQSPSAGASLTLRDLLHTYLERRGLHLRRAGERRRAIETGLKAFLNRPAAEIGRRELRARLESIAYGKGGRRPAPIAANRLLAYVRALYSWAVKSDLLDASPAAGIGPIAPERPKTRVLAPAEIRRLWMHLESTDNPVSRALRLILLTAQRPGEVCGMKWAELDLEARSWTIPAGRSKTHQEHRVPLSPAAVAVINACPRDGEYLHPGRWGRTPCLAPGALSHALARWRKPRLVKTRIEGEWREVGIVPPLGRAVHPDLRRTAATIMAEAGNPPRCRPAHPQPCGSGSYGCL